MAEMGQGGNVQCGHLRTVLSAPLVLYGVQTREVRLAGFVPSLWERWRRQCRRRMLRSVEALGKDKYR